MKPRQTTEGALAEAERRTRDTLPASEVHLRQILNSVPGHVIVMTAAGEVEFLNQQVLDYFGRTLEDLKDWTMTDVVHPDDLPRVIAAWQRSVETGEPYDMQFRGRRADGVYRWLHTRGLPVRDAHGAITGWSLLQTDIEEQKRSEQSLGRLIETLPAMVWRTTADGKPDYVNRRWTRYSGKSLADAQHPAWIEYFIHPDDVEMVIGAWTRARETGTPLELTNRVRGADGSYRWFQTRVEPMRDEMGRIINWYGVDVDIDDRKKAEDELRLLIETLPAMVWRTTADGEQDYINHRLAKYLGKSAMELTQNRWRSIMHPDDVDSAARDWARALETGLSLTAQYRLRRADGVYRWFQIHGEPLHDIDGRIVHWYGVQIDIDDLKRTEEALRATQADLSRASQLAAVAELAASIAHELSQPLAALIANGHASQRWLSADPPSVERARLTAERIIRDANAAAEVVSRTRALFRRTDLTRTQLHLNDVVREVSRLMSHEASSGNVRIDTDLQVDLPPIWADRVQMQQLIVNLVRNGIEAMESEASHPRVLSIRSRSDDTSSVLIEIRDHGSGLKDVEKVFEPFFTTKEEGMGMGLAICRWIVEAHKGRLWATNSSPRGTTFSFTLPISPRDSP